MIRFGLLANTFSIPAVVDMRVAAEYLADGRAKLRCASILRSEPAALDFNGSVGVPLNRPYGLFHRSMRCVVVGLLVACF